MILFTFVVATCLAMVSCGTGGQDASKVGDIDSFRSALEADGFTVQEGKLDTFDVLGMYDAGITPSCYGNNAQAPYMTYKLPVAPGQTTTNTISDAPI
ncbi:MAG: hypothetical protein AB1384_12730, partial [Actinomycetota bacterium]